MAAVHYTPTLDNPVCRCGRCHAHTHWPGREPLWDLPIDLLPPHVLPEAMSSSKVALATALLAGSVS